MLKIKPKNFNGQQNNNSKKENKKNNRSSKTVQELLGIKSIEGNVIKTVQGNKYFIRIAPKNINILPDNMLLNIINNLKEICNMSEDIEFLAVDKVERMEDNKNFINELLDEERDPVYMELLENDLEYFQRLETSNGASREFYIIIPFKDYDKNKQLFRDIEHALETKGFNILNCNKNIIKNMLQVYLERNFSGEVVRDFDLM